MKIAVCIKQVPSGSADMDYSLGVLKRTGAGNMLNPADLYAIEAALQAKEALAAKGTDSVVCAITMGPASAQSVLQEAIAMGADRGVLLCDKAFAGADVYATAFAIASGMAALGGFDLVFCGQQSTDGDTAQLPFSLAVQLGASAVGWAKSMERITDTNITVLQELSGGVQRLTAALPAVVAVGADAVVPRAATLRNKLQARKAPIQTLGLENLAVPDAALYGLKASPTRVIRVYEADMTAKAKPLPLTPSEAAERILKEMSV